MPVGALQHAYPSDAICILVDCKVELSQDGGVLIVFARSRRKERLALQLHGLALLRPLLRLNSSGHVAHLRW
jgi:hypothetical protein